MTEQEKYAYTAGFIDGEGHFRYQNHGLHLTVGQTNREVLDTLCLWFDCGKVCVQKQATNGHKTAYEWRLSGDNAYFVYQKIRKYLVVKRLQADKAVGFWLQGPIVSKRIRLNKEMRNFVASLSTFIS